jgi:GrpB-like predicted nucleotidyltransferase (UPF0157 family)
MAAVYIEPYNPTWPARFEEERALLANTLRAWLVGPIEHVGSTSVPGLSAKPIIDIMAGVESLSASAGAIPAAVALGYCYSPYKPDVMHWFCKPTPEHRTHHLHLIPFRSELWHDRLAFRDALRNDDALAAQYERLKLELAERYRHDREAYTEAKTEFITGVVSTVRGHSR